jgi:nucleotide-binding universal stress UspA family protein
VSNAPKPYVILAAVSFDETGEYALQEAARHTDVNGSASLHLVHVVADSVGHALDDASTRVTAELSRRVETLWATKPLKITAHIRAGKAASSILQTAADIDADLIVVGTHRRGGVEKLVLGSVADSVLREAHCPVLVAAPKDYVGAEHASRVEPPCDDCLAVRAATNNQQHWCERHSRTRLRPHVYEPSDGHSEPVIS